MATFLLSGANGAADRGWHSELVRVRPEIDGAGGLVNLSMAASGPLSALAQIALARAADGDVFVWDHADGVIACVKEAGYDPIEALRAVELFLRGCARRKIIVAPVISERLAEARSVDLEEVQLRLTHLFERYALPTLSMTSELRAALGARDLKAQHFSADGAVYRPERPVSTHLARAVAEHARLYELAKRAPLQRSDNVYPSTSGVLRVAFHANADAMHDARTERVRIGPLSAELIEIDPGGSVEYDVEGELLGLAAVIGPEEGLLRFSVDSEGFDDLRKTPISLWTPNAAASLGQVNLSHLLGRRATLPFPTRVVIHNVSNDPGLSVIRADHGAAPPIELDFDAKIRLLALIERRPRQSTQTVAVKTSAAD